MRGGAECTSGNNENVLKNRHVMRKELLGEDFFHFLRVWHRTDGALARGDNPGCGIGKAQHGVQVLLIQPVDAVFQQVVQHTCAEGIAGAGGFNDPAQFAGGFKYPVRAGQGVAAAGCRRRGRSPLLRS